MCDDPGDSANIYSMGKYLNYSRVSMKNGGEINHRFMKRIRNDHRNAIFQGCYFAGELNSFCRYIIMRSF